MRRRAWIYVLSVAAVLGPAAGIAYLGAVSYRDERGAVSAQSERQTQAARAVAARISAAIAAALDEVDRAAGLTPPAGEASDPDRPRIAAPLGRYWFWIDGEQRLRVPRSAPTTVELGGAVDTSVGCGERRSADACERELRTRSQRVEQLRAGQRAEAARAWAEARRAYIAAARDDTEPVALLGQARVNARLGDPARADQALAELERKFGDRAFEGVPVRLVVATLRAEAAGPDALLAVAASVLDGKYRLDPVVRLGVIARLRERLARALTAEQRARRAALDERVAAVHTEARRAAGLADDLGEVVRTATASWRGRPASRLAARTLVYRRRADGGIVGIAVDAPMLEQVADQLEVEVAQRARPMVLPIGGQPDPQLRKIADVPFGEALPHLALALVNPITDPDPLDQVIRERSRRHVMYTSALAIALGLGLLATVRGAARARELAQLKSDFVSTVSHELKTPLTSIRMFAEMLEQGVAQGDPHKLARYHGVIVQESQRLGVLIANLLDYAQIERGTRRYTPARAGIAELARQAVATFETLHDPATAGARNAIEVAVSPPAMRAEVDADRDVVVQALLNLLANAVKYGGAPPAGTATALELRGSEDQDGEGSAALELRSSENGSSIQVAVGADAEMAWVAVRDHGPGIPPAEQARIFREFYRAPDAYRSGVEGTGLGLALVKRHIEALGGSVEVASVVGEGATFTIRLPRVAGEPRPDGPSGLDRPDRGDHEA